jgi:dTDP-4-dehydrorhamnose reductase
MKILITGANGQLAREFQKLAGTDPYEITAFDRERLDIADPAAVEETLTRYTPNVLLNCAAYNFVDKAEACFDDAYRVNALGVKTLAAACRKSNILLVHYSSDYVFDGTKEDFYTEEDEPNPLNRYGKSKLDGEIFLREETDRFLLFRVSWVFGEGEQNFLYKLSEWAKKNRVLKIVCDQISIPTYTKDIVNLSMFAIQKGLSGTYHLTNGGYASRYEVARYFLERLEMDSLILPVGSGHFPTPAQRPYFSAMSSRKLSDALNVTIPDWKLGIDRYIETMSEKEGI